MSIQARKSTEGQVAYLLQNGQNTITTDLVSTSGGNDLGFTPHDLFDASLAACTVLTLSVYAKQKNWPLEDIHVKVERDDSEEKKGRYRLKREIDLIGALDAEQRQRLMDVADKCPIHKLMHATIEIQTTAA